MILDDASKEHRFHEALGRYFEAAGSGSEPDRTAWMAENPDLADDFAAFFADQDRLARMVGRPEAPAREFGDYEILREIARGGMGVVFEARQKSLNRVVALKMILSGSFASGDDLRRFQIEAEAAAGLDHPNIVPIHEVGSHDGRPYFSMKFMNGGTLADRIADYGADPEIAAALMATVARAVHHAHQRGVLHRDLKPSNILMDAEGRPHVADFGLARKIEGEDTITTTGALIGSPPYMAPEQTLGRKEAISTATDVYGLGAVLYALLTGKPPFRGDSALETIEMVREKAPEPPSKINAKVDRDLETICLKCLEKDASRRYASASDLADDLDRMIQGEPIAARPIGRFEHAWRWCKHNPEVAALSAAVFAVVVLGVSGVVWQWRAAVRNAKAVIKANDSLKDALRKARFNTYVANIHLADREWEDSNVSRAKELLDDPTTEEFRSFEWHYLHRKFHPELATFRGHTKTVSEVAFSPDGRRIASASHDKTVKVWDVATGENVVTFKGHSGAVYDVAFSPDGGRIVAGCQANANRKVWDADSGKLVMSIRAGGSSISDAAFSPDGRRIAAAVSGAGIRVWDAESGQEMIALKDEVITFGGHIAFSPDGRRIAQASDQYVDFDTLRVWGTSDPP